jgi:hypothetical protein
MDVDYEISCYDYKIYKFYAKYQTNQQELGQKLSYGYRNS